MLAKKSPSKMLLVAIVIATMFLISVNSYSEGQVLKYNFASKRIDGAIWGMAKGDVNGDGEKEIVLLKRSEVLVGRFEGDTFKSIGNCGFDSPASGARVYTIDLDGSSEEEIVVSAVEDGMPASFAMSFKEGKCSTIASHAKWSVRVIESQGGAPKKLIGQSWSSQSYFFGPVRELKFEKGRLKEGEKLDLPKRVGVYQFAELPPDGEVARVAVLKGYLPLEVFEKRGKNFKGIWRSGRRFGGSMNLLPAEQRMLLDEAKSTQVAFDLPPLVLGSTDFVFLGLQNDMPLKNVIGKRPQISGGEIMAFRPDPAFSFVEDFKTQRLPGVVSDYLVDNARENGAKKLLILVQDDSTLFLTATKSIILGFDIPTGY